MVLIVIAATALYRWIRGLIQQHAARQHPQGRTEQARIPQLADPAPPTSPDTLERLVLQHIGTSPEQINERTGRHARLTPTCDLVQAGQQQ